MSEDVNITQETRFKDAFDYLQVISKDEEKRMAYEARQMWLMDQRTREEIAREEGEKEGEKRGEKIGEKNAKIEVARKMLRRGVKLEYIAEDTGLSIAEIQELAQSIQ